MAEADFLLPKTVRGASCAATVRAALDDIGLRPEVVHFVGVGDAERSLDFEALSKGLAPGARAVLVGPHAAGARMEPKEELRGPVSVAGLQVSVFPQTYQRFLIHAQELEAPQLVVLFHPGLDVHYFTWYPCLRHWAETRVPVLFTAYRVPGGLGETPQTVQSFLETLLGTGGGAGLWVIEEENPHCIEDGAFNAGYFVTLGSQGALPVLAEEMYWPIFQALQKIGHPFAPRVGYLDLDDEPSQVSPENLSLLSAIAEGAVRGARAGTDGVDEETARAFAAKLLDEVVGPGAGAAWLAKGNSRQMCPNTGEGFDSIEQHLSICPAVGRVPLYAGDEVRLARLTAARLNGKVGVLQHFARDRQRWVVRLDGRDALFKATNLDKV